MSPSSLLAQGTLGDKATPVSSEPNPDPAVLSLQRVLTSESSPLALRFRALFSLKHLASLAPATPQTVPAIQAIAAAFSSDSALLKHELAYCLGQSRNAAAAPFLRHVLEDTHEDAMCRHEAAEALAALGDQGSLDLLKHFRDREGEADVVRETCEIAVARIEWAHSSSAAQEKLQKSAFASIDPAPPFPLSSDSLSTSDLQTTLLDTSLPLFDRYRAMFHLRDRSPTDPSAIDALASGFQDPSALFRHEIAFVFGQLSDPLSIPALKATLRNVKEASMVRHEAAEALGSMGDHDGVEEILREFLQDEERVVRESCMVALDMAEYEKSGEMEYALLPDQEATISKA